MHDINFASFWPGYDVSVHSRCATQITFALEPRSNHLPLCGKCHQPCPLVHDRRTRLVRDRDLFELRVRLQVPIRRVDCLHCGRVSEHIAWLPPSSRITQRLQSWVEALLELMPISHVNLLTGLHWHTCVFRRS